MTHVSELINPVTGQWDQLVMDTFSEQEAQLILKMPLREGAIDFIAWHFDPRGLHSVRNAYRLFSELELQKNGTDTGSSLQRPEVLGGRGQKKWWRIWKLSCPEKVKHFWWRCAHNSLAIRDNLIRRGVKVENPNCILCRIHEDGCHLFVKCKEVKELWRVLGYERLRRQLEVCTDIESTMDIIWKLPEAQKIQIITFWWLWWRERNRVREGEIPTLVTELAYQVKCTAAEFLACYAKGSSIDKARGDRWIPPPEGVIKFNIDGAFVNGKFTGGWGVIARSTDGEVVAARAGNSSAIYDSFTAELRAMEEAFYLASDLGVIRAIFETDAQELAMVLNNRKPDYSREAPVIEDIKVQSRTWFSSCSIRFSRRAANRAAHDFSTFWFEL
jgi:ribonuclease HI